MEGSAALQHTRIGVLAVLRGAAAGNIQRIEGSEFEAYYTAVGRISWASVASALHGDGSMSG
jgi:hypothetical protein